MTNSEPLLTMKGISKSFPAVKALIDVDMELYPGEVLIIVGENGAGKSTLMKIIAGALSHDSGEIILENRPVSFANPAEAQDNGIRIVYQEQALIPDLNAVENIFLGIEDAKVFSGSVFGILDKKKMHKEAVNIIKETFDMEIDPSVPIAKLPMVQKQIVEIIRAIVKDTKILILDEPTSALEDEEREHLFSFIRKLKATGVGIIYCSHYIEECIEIGDRIIALRDGIKVGESLKEEATLDNIVELMVGKKLSDQFPKEHVPTGEAPLLKVESLSLGREYHDISLELYPGEIVGIAGLAGCGKVSFARTIFGINRPSDGSITVNNTTYTGGYTCLEAMENNIAFLPADRKSEGLFLDQSVQYNITLSNLDTIMSPWLKNDKEKAAAKRYVDSLKIKTPHYQTICRNLSGGNQQKVMIARWLFNKPNILIFEEPTRGIDVNAKVDVYLLINSFLKEGGGVIIVSSEIPELEGMCDRVLVFHNGALSQELSGENLTKDNIAYYSVTTTQRGMRNI